MIGNVIDSRFFRVVDYPTAAALSFTLMAAILRAGRRLHPPRRDGGARMSARSLEPVDADDAGRAAPGPRWLLRFRRWFGAT